MTRYRIRLTGVLVATVEADDPVLARQRARDMWAFHFTFAGPYHYPQDDEGEYDLQDDELIEVEFDLDGTEDIQQEDP